MTLDLLQISEAMRGALKGPSPVPAQGAFDIWCITYPASHITFNVCIPSPNRYIGPVGWTPYYYIFSTYFCLLFSSHYPYYLFLVSILACLLLSVACPMRSFVACVTCLFFILVANEDGQSDEIYARASDYD